ncbi:hypothetical protein lerEdw1_004609 [Lerista edwardsae]|nr:hypothetical protein lerEdw1_004609 [Lerista edwardsae]
MSLSDAGESSVRHGVACPVSYDLSPSSADIKAQGERIADALTQAGRQPQQLARGVAAGGPMSLTAADKTNVKGIWTHVAGRSEAFGTEFLNRLFAVFPATKTYFPSYDLTPSSADIKAHGKRIADALTQAVNHLDDVAGTFSALSDLHAQKLRVDPVNFGKLRECILVTLAAHHGSPIKADVLCSLDKFLCHVGDVLTSKYR